MSFLDRFKRKASEEKTPENAPEVKSEITQEAKPDSTSGTSVRKVDPAIQLAAATVAAGYNPDFKLPPRKEKEATAPAAGVADPGPQHEVVLDLGDFLPRLPTQMLKEGPHDPKIPLTFDIAELADRISRGQTTISLTEVYRRTPGIFRAEVLPSDATEIRFPWQKVMKMLTAYKSAAGGPAPAGLSSAAAETLSEKLRSRRGVRNIIPGGPPPEAPAAPTPSPLAAPAKPPELVLPTSNSEEDEKMTKEEALKARDQIRGMLARIKGEFERHLAAGEHQRKALTEEREKMIVDLVRSKKEIDDKLEQVEFEKSVAAKSTDNLAKAQQERDSFKIELSNLKAEVNKLSQQNDQRLKELVTERDALAQQQANLSKQVAEFQKRGKIGAILSAEAAPAAASAGAAAAERSQKEYQRQLEELQRRINVLETGQRDAAQELGREREAKIKLERQLATADRLQQESAAKVQEMQASLQREHEAAARKRDADAARALKEAQDQLASLQVANQKVQAEADEARKQLQAAQESAAAPADWEARATAQFEADIESYRTRIKALLQERGTWDSEKKKLAEQLGTQSQELAQQTQEREALLKAQSEAAAHGDPVQLIAENEKLQTQIKALQTERDGLATKTKSLDEIAAGAATAAAALQKLTADKEGTSAELAKVKSELAEVAAKYQQDLRQAQERHTAELTAKEAALQNLQAEPKADPAELTQLKTELAQLRTERDGLAAKTKSLDEITAGAASAAAALQKLTADKEGTSAELAKVKSELTEVAAKYQQDLRQAQERHTAELTAKEAALQELAQLRTERDGLAVKTKSLDEITAGAATAAAALQKLTADKEGTSAELAKVKSELTEVAAKYQQDLRQAQERHTAESTAKEAALQELAQLRTERDGLAVKTKSLDEITAGAATAAAALQKLTADNEGTSAELAKVKSELTEVAAKYQQDLRQAQERHTAESTAKEAALQELAQLRTERDGLAAKTQSLGEIAAGAATAAAALQKLTADKEGTSAELAKVKSELTEVSAKYQQDLRQAQERHTAESTAKEAALQELAQLRTDSEAARLGNGATIETLREENRKAGTERDALSAELNRLKAAQQASKERLESELTAALKARESESKTLGELRTATEKFFAEKKALTDEVTSLRSAYDAASSEAKAASEKTIAELRAGQEKLHAEKTAVAEEVAALQASSMAAASAAKTATDKILAELHANQAKLAAEKQTLTEELASLRSSHDSTFTATKEAHDKALATLTSDRDDLRTVLAAHTKDLEVLRKQRDELISGRESLTAENFAARSSLEKSLAEVTRHRDDLVNKVEIMASELAGAKQEHGLAFAALDRDRDSLRAAKDAIAAEFASTRTSLEKTIAELHVSHDTLAAHKSTVDQQLANAIRRGDDLQSRLEKTETALREVQATLKQREEATTKLANDHVDVLAKLTTKHEDVLAALAAEKDATIAKLTSEKSTLVAEVDQRIAALKAGHEKAVHSLRDEKSEAVIRLTEEMNATVSALTADRDKVRDILAETERKYLAEIASLLVARDSARSDSAAVAERLAAVSVEAVQKHAELTQERDDILGDKQRLTAELEQARETHKAQAGVFASEFKAVVKQRDDFISQLEAERKNLADKTASFERDRAALTAAESEMKARTEREIARIRRERDSIAQQRDALRGRIEKLMDDQRQMLEDVASQAAFTSMKHNEPTPVSMDEAPEPEMTPEPPPQPKPRETRAWEPRKKEANVIDITEAEVVSPLQGGEGRLKMPRVRPVIIPPPQVRNY